MSLLYTDVARLVSPSYFFYYGLSISAFSRCIIVDNQMKIFK